MVASVLLGRIFNISRFRRFRLFLPLFLNAAPPGDVFIVFLQRAGKGMPPGSIGDEIEVGRPGRIGNGFK